MPILLINGNLNQHTFVNASLAAHFDSRRRLRKELDAVLVLHSRESFDKLLPSDTEWRTVLRSNGLNPAIFEHIEVDLQNDPTVVAEFASHIERLVSNLSPEDSIYVDLTNGQSLQKAALGAVAYVLGAKDQFIIDTRLIGKTVDPGFLNEADLARTMVKTSDPMVFDSVALAWFTEVRRFRELASKAKSGVARILHQKDPVSILLWEAEILQAVRSWLTGEKQQQVAQLGASVRHSGLALEELVKGLHGRLAATGEFPARPRQKLSDLITEISTKVPQGRKEKLVECLAHLLRDLRNSSSHGFTPANLASRRARISIEILFAIVEYWDSCFGSAAGGQPVSPHGVQSIDGTAKAMYYFGLDGDSTGDELERLFREDADAASMKAFSTKIETAIKQLAKIVTSPPISGEIIFCAGDDLLFSGAFDRSSLEILRKRYLDATGLTCSIGFGVTLKEAYCALKIAKSRPGKNSLSGVRVT